MSRLLAFTGARASLLARCPAFPLAGGARFATTLSNDDKKKYSATLLLPKTPMQLRLKSPLKTEDKLRDRTTHELYREQVSRIAMTHAHLQYEKNDGDIFILHDGPPYANGNLHMGK